MITNLNEKLNGELSVTREELFKLVSSWGRKEHFNVTSLVNLLHIPQSDCNECYDLSNLDVSQIENLNSIFKNSYYNGDLSKWDVSNCKYMNCMFQNSDFNNDSLKDWNVSNVGTTSHMFKNSEFNGDLSGWNILNVENMDYMFKYSKFNNNSINHWDISNVKYMECLFELSEFDGDLSNWIFNKDVYCAYIVNNSNFQSKYNLNDEDSKLLLKSKTFVNWLYKNKEMIKNIHTPKQEVMDFFDFNNKNNGIENDK